MKIHIRNHKLLTQMPGELEHEIKCRCKQSFTLDDISNTLKDAMKRTKIGKNSLYRCNSFKEEQPYRFDSKDNPKDKMEDVTKKKNTCHNCESTDHYANNCTKENKKFYAIEQVPEDSESDSMGDVRVSL
ncbi:hypothetical protein O181_035853 [Austropuccinia psidii MF-1]|uniref:CCHC-type domain-containing protein n=1 Tax=Austropuccinia psidii MF-1 TaxID=1389203 RepID=A0A9Q3D8B6_9BASI|nr:hypothetical protein [Austropuccinia psidii MF-1]